MMKRFFDLLLTLPGILFIFPLILLTALLVRIKIGKPILFIQERPGLHGKPFRMYKFRTMTDERNADGKPLSDEKRLVPFGRFLRSASLDELPELINVLKGEMSLVGPRPLLIEYLDRYTPEQARRHDVLPGITGWAQVNGRQNIPFSKRLKLDIWYIEHWSILLDIKILFKTMANVFKRKGVISGQDVNDVDDLGLSCNTESISESTKREGK
jgi:sugar transferase EpsL